MASLGIFLPIVASAQSGTNGYYDSDDDTWIAPGTARTLPAVSHFENEFGSLGVVNDSGPIETEGHAFFEPLGSNGRACISCHQPADSMSLSLATIRQRWEATQGKDPIFAPIDGANCPNATPGDPESHSLLLNRGLFRVSLPWPPKSPDGNPIEPEFDIEVVRDPTGCNTDAIHGLYSANPTISVYRRPRPAANLRYVVTNNFGVSPITGKNGMAAARDPDTNLPVNMNLMSDAREPTLRTQAASAAKGHLQFNGVLTTDQLNQIEAYERQLYAAQDIHIRAGNLGEEGGPSGLGVYAMVRGRDGLLGNNLNEFVFPIEDAWYELPRGEDPNENAINEFRESVARGHDVFFFRTFWIKDAMHINTVGLGNPVKRTCSTCHGGHLTGMDAANGWMDIGSTNLPWAMEAPFDPWTTREPELPLFKLTCKEGVDPHTFLGREIYTQDPGRALISGRCDDIGTIVIQQMRGLAGRAPYFSNGSAQNLSELVDFYDRRFNIRYTEQEKRDLINFLSTL